MPVKRIDEETLGILSRLDCEGNAARITDGQLDRKQYLTLNAILETMGGKWNKKAKAHLFDGNPSELIDSVILTGEITTLKDAKKEFGFFPTPSHIVDRLIDMADLSEGMLVLEPSAGDGAIAIPIKKLGYTVDCIEIQSTNVEKLVANGLNVIHADFLQVEPKPLYDRVIMNPPFTKQQDIDHVLHASKCLKKGGKLVAVMSASVLFRENKKTKEFRDFIEQHEGEVTELDEGAFKESGTMVRTVVVEINV